MSELLSMFRTESPRRYRKRASEKTPLETNDTELARARQAAWAIAQLRGRHAADRSYPTIVELLREASLLLAITRARLSSG